MCLSGSPGFLPVAGVILMPARRLHKAVYVLVATAGGDISLDPIL